MAASLITTTSDLFVRGRETEERRTDYVCVLALVDTTAPRTLVLPVRDAFDPHLPTGDVRVVAADAQTDLLAPTAPDVCVAVMGSDGQAMAAGVCELAAAGVPVALVCESALDVPDLHMGQTSAQRVSIISATSEAVLVERLAEWLVGATDKDIAFAANFPFCRKAKVRELVNAYAKETATLTAKLGPKGELPSMTAGQVNLALSIAAINGEPLALSRIPEVLMAVSAGFGSRMMANKALGKLPFVGWFLRVGLGYLGPQATGHTLQHRFEKRERKAEDATTPTADEESPVQRFVRAVRGRVARAGEPVRSSSAGTVRLLGGSDDGGVLVYEQEDEA